MLIKRVFVYIKDISARAGIFSPVNAYRAGIFSPVNWAGIFHAVAINFEPGLRKILFCVHVLIEQRRNSVISFVMTRKD